MRKVFALSSMFSTRHQSSPDLVGFACVWFAIWQIVSFGFAHVLYDPPLALY